jgi:Cu/Ag efflux protein CusF
VNKKSGVMNIVRGPVPTAAGIVLAAVLMGMSAGTALAADQSSPAAAPKPDAAMTAKPAPFMKESLHQMTATVEAISMDTREVTLRGKDGTVQTIKVGPEARNLAQVKVGDKVTVSYYESFAAQMRKHDKPNEGFQTAAGAITAAPGERPGAAAAQSIASTVTIDSVDVPGNKVTFHRTDGVVITIPVQTDAGRKFVSTLKKGDVVDVMYTEALAVDVTEAKDKSK